MSATCDAQQFINYFTKKLENGELIKANSINCPSYMYSVKTFYLDDIISDKICQQVSLNLR